MHHVEVEVYHVQEEIEGVHIQDLLHVVDKPAEVDPDQEIENVIQAQNHILVLVKPDDIHHQLVVHRLRQPHGLFDEKNHQHHRHPLLPDLLYPGHLHHPAVPNHHPHKNQHQHQKVEVPVYINNGPDQNLFQFPLVYHFLHSNRIHLIFSHRQCSLFNQYRF